MCASARTCAFVCARVCACVRACVCEFETLPLSSNRVKSHSHARFFSQASTMAAEMRFPGGWDIGRVCKFGIWRAFDRHDLERCACMCACCNCANNNERFVIIIHTIDKAIARKIRKTKKRGTCISPMQCDVRNKC